MMRELTETEKATLIRKVSGLLGEGLFIDLVKEKLQCFGQRKARLMIEADDEPITLCTLLNRRDRLRKRERIKENAALCFVFFGTLCLLTALVFLIAKAVPQ